MLCSPVRVAFAELHPPTRGRRGNSSTRDQREILLLLQALYPSALFRAKQWLHRNRVDLFGGGKPQVVIGFGSDRIVGVLLKEFIPFFDRQVEGRVILEIGGVGKPIQGCLRRLLLVLVVGILSPFLRGCQGVPTKSRHKTKVAIQRVLINFSRR